MNGLKYSKKNIDLFALVRGVQWIFSPIESSTESTIKNFIENERATPLLSYFNLINHFYFNVFGPKNLCNESRVTIRSLINFGKMNIIVGTVRFIKL